MDEKFREKLASFYRERLLNLSKGFIESEDADPLLQDHSKDALPNGIRIGSVSGPIGHGFRCLRKGDDLNGLWGIFQAFPYLQSAFNMSNSNPGLSFEPPLHRIYIYASSSQAASRIASKGTAVMIDTRKRFPPLTFRLYVGYERKQLLRALHTVLNHSEKEDRHRLWGYLLAEGLKEYAESLGKEGTPNHAGQIETVKRAVHREHHIAVKRKVLEERKQRNNRKAATSRLADLSLSPLKEDTPVETNDRQMEG